MTRRSLPLPLILGLCLGLLLSNLRQPALAQATHTSPAIHAPAPAVHAPAPAVHAPTPAQAPPQHPAGTEAASHSPEDAVSQLLLGLVVILVSAKLAGELFERIGQPAVLGEILAGILVGNLALAGFRGLEFMRGSLPLQALSELGVILLLFEVGLESNVQEMRRVGWSSLLVATLGVIVPMGLGWGVSRLFLPTASPLTHLFIGATLCATSVGITARVLKDLNQLHRAEARIVLGAAVLDDVLGLVVLAVVSGVITAANRGGRLDALSIAWIVAKAVLFLVGAVAVGSFLSPRVFKLASHLNVRHVLLVTSLAFCFLLARLAGSIGLAPIVGAFAAGLILDPIHYQDFRDRGEHTIEELVQPIAAFLVPVFFVMTGMSVDLRPLGNVGILGLAVALTVAAVLGKQVCALGVLEKGLDRLAVGVGMIPRGEVGLIFANIGRGLFVAGAAGVREPVISGGLFSAVVVMVMATTLITPPLLKWALTRRSPAAPS